MIEHLAFAAFLVALTVTIHFFGLMALLWVLRSRADALHAHQSWIRQGGAIVLVVLGLMAIHTAQVWIYAAAYLSIDALPDLETALYFSTSSFTTIGYAMSYSIEGGGWWRPLKAQTGCCCLAGRRPF